HRGRLRTMLAEQIWCAAVDQLAVALDLHIREGDVLAERKRGRELGLDLALEASALYSAQASDSERRALDQLDCGSCRAFSAESDLRGREVRQDVDGREAAGLEVDAVAAGDRERSLGDGHFQRGPLESDQRARNSHLGKPCSGTDQNVSGLHGNRQSLRLAAP